MNAFKPASLFTERHGLFVALVGGTNSGKTFSALRLARGIAGPSGKIAVCDTEAGRTLHLKRDFMFDVMLLDPPHRPHRYAEAAKQAEDAGYDALVIDSFSAEWAGMGGVLSWADDEVSRMAGDDMAKRERLKGASWIKPKSAHKAMVYSLLERRIPIIFSIRGEETFKPPNDKFFKAVCNQNFLFEVTVSFRLATARKGVIDLSDPASWKMEGSHRSIFRDGDQLSEEHGAQLSRWARGEVIGQPGASIDMAALVDEADAAVERGTDAYAALWGRLSKDEKRALLDDHEARKARAAQADQAPGNDDDTFPGARTQGA